MKGVLSSFSNGVRPRSIAPVAMLALMLGGALGNLIDRIHQGHVTDFVDIGPWPVFNLADSAIVVGLVMMGWLLVIQRDQSNA